MFKAESSHLNIIFTIIFSIAVFLWGIANPSKYCLPEKSAGVVPTPPETLSPAWTSRALVPNMNLQSLCPEILIEQSSSSTIALYEPG